MAFLPVGNIAPNYRDFKNYWFKAYEPGTTTPKTISLDSSGSVTAAKLQLDKDGFIESSGNAIVMPYLEGDYDAYLFPTEAEADANDTVNATQIADNLSGSVTEAFVTGEFDKRYHDTLADWQDDLTAEEDNVVNIKERVAGQGGGFIGDVIPSGTENGFDIIKHNTLSLSIQVRETKPLNLRSVGVLVSNSATDNSNAMIAMAAEYSDLYLPAGTYQFDKGSQISWSSNQTFRGAGQGVTILNGFFSLTDGSSSINLSDFTIELSNKPLQFLNGNDIHIRNIDVLGDPVEVSPRGVEITDCNDTSVSFSKFENIQYGVYYKQGSAVGTVSTNGKVIGNTFIQNDVTMSFPAGVYFVGLINGLVKGNYFNCPESTNQGYGFYQGDNTIQQCKDVVISGNEFVDSNDSDIRIDKCFDMTITGNTSRGSGIFIRSNGDLDDPITGERSNNIVLSGNVTRGVSWLISGQSRDFVIDSNVIEGASGAYGIRFLGDAIGTPIKDVQITNNKFNNIGRSGIVCQNVIGADIRGNRFKNCNTDNETSNTSDRSKCIVCATADEVNIFDNYGENDSGTGFARYLIELNTGSLPNARYGNNFAKGMVVANYRSAYTSAPTAGDWVQGDIIPIVAPSAGSFIGFVCVAGGTPGTWKTYGAITA